tara:strand:+ start:15001 stop:17607 length:2607 start_codon:yes stop_codon:yes gene_type:complete
MSTYYIDYENGNDSADGTSFANRKATIPSSWALSGGDEVRIMGSPDPTLVGTGNVFSGYFQKSYSNQSIYANIAYSTTTGETTIGPYSNFGKQFPSTGGTIFIFENSDTSLNGTWTVTKVNDNTIKLDGYTAASNTTASSVHIKFFVRTYSTIMLNTPVTKNIASFGPRTTTWTASTNVTTSLVTASSFMWGSSNQRINEHYHSDQITIDAAFGTGKAAYWATGGLDLSGYQQISFKLLGNGTGQHYGSNCSLRLCSDSSGNTTVNTLNFDLKGYKFEVWAEVVVDLGSNFGNNINSIALYVDTDQGAQAFVLNNIIACKASSAADSLTHRSVVGLNTTSDPCWYGIESINDKRIILEQKNYGSSTHIGYYGGRSNAGFSSNLSNQNIYKRESNRCKYVIDTLGHTSSGYANMNSGISNSGQANSSWINVSGGWDRTNMSTQSLESSFIDGLVKDSTFQFATFYGCNISKIGTVRMKQNHSSGQYNSLEDIHCCHIASQNGFYSQSNRWRKIKNLVVSMTALISYSDYFFKDTSTAGSVQVNSDAATKENYEFYVVGGDMSAGFSLLYTSNPTYLGKITARAAIINQKIENNVGNITLDEYISSASGDYSLYFYNNKAAVTVNNCTSKNASGVVPYLNTDPDITVDNFVYTQDSSLHPPGFYPPTSIVNLTKGTLTLNNPQIADRQIGLNSSASSLRTSNDQFTGTYASSPISNLQGPWYRRNANNVSNVHETYFPRGLVKNNTTTRHTSSGYSWSFYNNNVAGTGDAPGYLKTQFGKFAVASGSQVTVKIWVYASNNYTPAQLIIGKNTLIGMTADIVTETTSYSYSWQELTAQVTPTAAGFIDVYVTSYGGSVTTNYFDDMSITQA